jgi:hypothetical protein
VDAPLASPNGTPNFRDPKFSTKVPLFIFQIEWSRIDAIPMGLPEAYLDKDSLYCLTPWVR